MTLSMSSSVPSNAPPLFFISITGVLSLSDQLHRGQVSCNANRLAHPPSVYFSRHASGAHHKLPGDGHDNTLFFLFPPSLSLVVIWVTMRHEGEKFIMQSVMSNERLEPLPTPVILTGVLHVIMERESRGECKLSKYKTLCSLKAFTCFCMYCTV